MKKKIMAMLAATMCLASSSLCFSSVAIAANPQGDVEIADVNAPSSEAQKSFITVDDILSLSKKGEALTWIDFEKYEHTDVGSGLIVWEFMIKDDSSKLLISGNSLEEKPEYINYVVSNGAVLDVRTEEFTRWFYDDSASASNAFISVNDILSLAEKGEALTWSDFEKYEHTDVGSGLIVWEFNIKDDSSKLLIGGDSLEEKPVYIRLKMSNGTTLDVQKDDLTSWYYDDATVHKGTKQMTLADVKELAKKSDELDWTDFSDYKGKDVGSGLYILEFELEDGYVLSVGGGHLNVKPEYILLSRSCETDGIDIRKDSVEGYLIMTADNTWTVEVKEITGKTLVVVPIYNSNDLITLDTKYFDDGIEPFVGMHLEVTFVGGILETYPAQFGNVKKVSVVSNDPIASGDVNNDGNFNISDVVLLQKWLLAVPDTNLTNWKAVDFCEDNKLNVFDLCLMKRALIEKMNNEPQNVDISFKFNSVTDIRYNDDNHTKWTGFVARSENDLINILAENEGVSADKASIEGIDSNTFKDKSIVIVYSICTAGNSYSIIDNISVKGTSIEVSTISKKPMVPTPDMLFRRYVYVIDKNAVTNADSFNFTDESSYYQYDEENEAVAWFKVWCQAQ